MAAGNAEPPMWLRVNRGMAARDAYLARLAADAGFGAEAAPSRRRRSGSPCRWTFAGCPALRKATCRCRTSPRSSRRHCLAAAPGMRVLDACAAPGGKACHILELEPGIAELVALDVDAARARAHRVEPRAPSASPAHVVVGDAPNARGLVGRHAVRPHPARRALLRHRASSAGIRTSSCCAAPPTSRASRRQQPRCCAPAWGLLAPGGRLVVCQLLGALRPKTPAVVGAFLAGEPAAFDVTESARLLLPGRTPGRSRGRAARCERRGRRRRLLLRLPREAGLRSRRALTRWRHPGLAHHRGAACARRSVLCAAAADEGASRSGTPTSSCVEGAWQLDVRLDLGLSEAARQAFDEGVPLTLCLEVEATIGAALPA